MWAGDSPRYTGANARCTQINAPPTFNSISGTAFASLTSRTTWAKLWAMKLRFDLVKKVTPEMLKKSVLANNHRYKAEPLLSQTGTGGLSPASTEERASEEKLSLEIARKLMRESDNSGKKPASGS